MDQEILKKRDANLAKFGMLLLLYLHNHTSKKAKTLLCIQFSS